MSRIAALAGSLVLTASVGNAGIIGTEVFAGMEITYGNPGVTDAIDEDSGPTLASVSIVGPVTGASAAATLALSGLTSEEATLGFNIAYDGNGYPSFGYMGQSEPDSNGASIDYHAVVNSVLDYSWNFDYSGTNPFGLQTVRILQNGVLLANLGDFGAVGHHEGAGTFALLAGNDYLVEVLFFPNVFGGIGGIEGNLVGQVAFDFNGTAVPEPSSLVLVTLGAAALLATRVRGRFRGTRP